MFGLKSKISVVAVLLTGFVCFSQNPKTKINQYIQRANEYIEKSNDSALLYIEKAKKLNSKSLSPIEKVKLLEVEAAYYDLAKSDYQKAIPYYLEALKIAEKNKLTYAKDLYHTLGAVFHVSDNYEKAKNYYDKAYELSVKEKDTQLLVKSLINLGSIHSSQKNYKKSEELFKESLKFPSDSYVKKITYSNLGNLKIREKKFKEALVYLNQSVKIDPEDFVKDAIDISYLLDAKAEVNDYTGIDTLLPICENLARVTKDLRQKTILLKSIGTIYNDLGDFKKAAFFKDQYIVGYDSLKAMQNLEQINELETKYQTQKKEEEIAKQEKEKNRLRLFFVLACITIALLNFLVYQFFKQRNRLKKQTQLLETAVDEKNILLKETHHRVKNSFQIVSSLLYLQSENMKDKEAALAVKEAQNRVKSMVLIHQKLYSKEQLIGIETKEYIEDLVNDIIENQTDTIPNLTTSIAVESTVFSIDSITPLGLIINELITNCIKHAFPPSQNNPKIELEFKKVNEMYLLTVNDNGIGFSNTISENSFGIKLITALAKKLKGKIAFENNSGTHFVMEIHKFEQMN
jgi:two-component system, sensor histidine kinase PdtaS